MEVALHLLPPTHVIDPAAPEVALHQVEMTPDEMADRLCQPFVRG